MIYQENIQKYESDLSKFKAKSRTIAYIRLSLFIGGIASVYLFSFVNWTILIAIVLAFMLPFLWLIQKNYHLKLKITHLKSLILINKTEIKLQNNELTQIYSGKDYINQEHKYSYDIDIFGESSIFILLNRSASVIGQNNLANWLNTPCLDKNKILLRQEAVAELSEKLDWRQDFQASGMTHLITHNEAKEQNKSNIKEQNKKALLEWIDFKVEFTNNKSMNLIKWIFPTITNSLLLLAIFTDLSIQFFFFSGLFQLIYLGFFLKKINKRHQETSKSGEIVANYVSLLNRIEVTEFQSSLLNKLKEKLTIDQQLASESTKQLKSIINSLDNRMNILLSFILNFLFLSDLHLIIKLEKWQEKHKEKLSDWLNVIKEYDTLSSFAGFSYNNPEFIFPEVSEKEFVYDIENGGHPVIPAKERVCNDFKLENKGSFSIITGANMAGKSTFLRTTAVNLILALCGSKVCATKFEFTPIGLFTSIRATDSLSKNESYFYAELKRLQSIIEEIKKGKQLFVIVDEMLRGTNSKDKHSGSKAFIEQIVKYNASGLIATHDVMLGVLEEELKGKITNKRFEVDLKNDKLYFDYKIQEGVSQNLNATFLMKKMGIIEK